MRPSYHRIWMSAVLALVLVFSLTYLAADATKLSSLVRIVDMWSLVALQPDRPGVFAEIDPRDFPAPPVPQAGDTLLTVNGLPATQGNYFAVFSPKTPRGIEVPITFRRGTEIFASAIKTRTIPGHLKVQFVTLFTLRVILVFGLILVGFWAFLRRGEVPAVRTLALFCFTAAVSHLVSVRAAADPYAAFRIPWGRVVLPLAMTFGAFAPVLWLRLSLQFPTPRKWYERRWLLVSSLLVLLVVLLFLLSRVRPTTVRWVFPLYAFACLATGLLLFWRSYRDVRDTLTRRQLRLVLIGAVPVVLMSAVNLVLTFRGQRLSNLTLLYIFNLNCVTLLCIPITFAYAFGRYRLLEIEGRLRRGTRFAAVNALVLLAFGGLLYGFGAFLLHRLRIESRTPTFALALVLALTFAPAQRRLRGFLERRFYPERWSLRNLLRDLIDSAGHRFEPEWFWSELAWKLGRGLRAESVRVFLRAPDGTVVERGEAAARLSAPPSTLWPKLAGLPHPIPFDELIASGRLGLSEEERGWVDAGRIAVVVPLPGSTERVGYLFLGPKAEEEDYSPYELDLLRSFATQIGLAVENLQLLGDRLERNRLEEQLGVARRIQEGLLPTILSVPGLEAAARIRFCLEVAGDFYDVVPLRDGRILLAIGDVAGKGVGAALLMSNAQASLRAMKNTGLPLGDTVAEINSLVFQITPDDVFITLFAAIYDPRTRLLVYVNAGHNPPLLHSPGAPARQLDEGGLLLGVEPAARYRQGQAILSPGDLVLMYTDGVTEARGAQGSSGGAGGLDDEYGLARLERILPELDSAPLERALDSIERDVRDFTGREVLDDDFTLLAVRVPRGRGNEARADGVVGTAVASAS